MKSRIETELKIKNINNLSAESKNTYKINTVNGLIKDINDKKNRYIFYCPDIAVVNPLVKLVYEVALQAKNAGYNVTILHEMQGFKAKWLFESEDYKEYKKLNVEYIINKVSKKSKREKNLYTFKVTDTLIVTDVYQEMLMNILSEESLKLMQKIVLVTGYMGISSLPPGMDYQKLDVNSLVFFDDNIRTDYETLFTNSKIYLLNNYPISNGFKEDKVLSNETVPVILVSGVGNNEKVQELINIFYNKYPTLNMFTFKIVAREDMNIYIENIATSAAYVILDKNIVTKQMIYETISMGVPVILPSRREFITDQSLFEYFCVDDDMFIMADSIATYCTQWLESSTQEIKNNILNIANDLGLKTRTPEAFSNTVKVLFDEFQKSRELTFNNIKENL